MFTLPKRNATEFSTGFLGCPGPIDDLSPGPQNLFPGETSHFVSGRCLPIPYNSIYVIHKRGKYVTSHRPPNTSIYRRFHPPPILDLYLYRFTHCETLERLYKQPPCRVNVGTNRSSQSSLVTHDPLVARNLCPRCLLIIQKRASQLPHPPGLARLPSQPPPIRTCQSLLL